MTGKMILRESVGPSFIILPDIILPLLAGARSPVGFAGGRGACAHPAEHSLALGTTPGLYASPLGLGWRLSSAKRETVIEPQRGSGMQPKGAEPGRGSLGNRIMPPRPGLRTAFRAPLGARRGRGDLRHGVRRSFRTCFSIRRARMSWKPETIQVTLSVLPSCRRMKCFYLGIDNQLERLGKIDDAI